MKTVFDVSITTTEDVTPQLVRLHVINTLVHHPGVQATFHSVAYADFDPENDRYVDPGHSPEFVLAIFTVDSPDLDAPNAVFSSLIRLADQKGAILGGGFDVKKEQPSNG